MQTLPSRRKAALSRAALAALALGTAAASSQAFEYKLSGHVNRLLMQVDDGTQSRLFNADNIHSQTRLRFTGTQEFAPGLVAGINWEVGYSSNPSSSISFSVPSVSGEFNERHAEVYVVSPWGKVSLGQGDGAANGGMETDLSGTTVIQYSGITDIGSGFAFRQGAVVGPTIGSTTGNLDFESRYDRVRYDAPKLGPVVLSGSYGTKGSNDVYELAARLDTRVAGGKLAAALGWSREKHTGATGNDDTAGGSISWLAPNGFNLTFALGTSENDNPASVRKDFAYAKVGYLTGKHAVSVDYGRGDDFALAGDQSTNYGVAYVYAAQKWLDLYAGAKQHKLDRAAGQFDKISFITAGMRLKF
ncbi:MAG: porin [Burkholderiaceae bacterium]|nr:porin [Burkholderiaceae bacterium]